MAAVAVTSLLVSEGDAAIYAVDNRRPAHQLEPGLCAAALNQRFDEGKPGPRPGVGHEPWGAPHQNVVSGTFAAAGAPAYTQWSYLAVILTAGEDYIYVPGDETRLTLGVTTTATVAGDIYSPTATEVAAGRFTAQGLGTYYLWKPVANTGDAATALILQRPGRTCGYGRFDDPNGTDNGVLLTDEWRTSDGGRGKAWRIYPGNVPQEIPLNGHDIWGTARLVQCDAQLVLLRHGAERHYFNAAAVVAASDYVDLNCEPAWENGDDVVVYGATDDASWPGGPNLGGVYYARKVSGNLARMELYDTAAHAINTAATTGRLDLPAADAGKFYVERQATKPGYYGNRPPPLRMVASDSETAFEVGFAAVPTAIAVTDSNAINDTITAPAHGLQIGDHVTLTLSTDGVLDKYAAPQSDHVLRLYDTEAHALADDGSTGLYNITVDSQTASDLKRQAASGLPMPGGEEGVYVKGRLVIVSGRNLLISDPLDILHFTPMLATLPTNQSASGSPTALIVGGNENVLIVSENNVQELLNLDDASQWKLEDITREFGGLAPLAALRVGPNAWVFNRRGVSVIGVTQFGIHQADPVPVSQPIQRRFESVDWTNARAACAAGWNNRVFFAVPLKGQSSSDSDSASQSVVNNGVLVWNDLNKGWEDLWQGDYLTPYAFARLNIAGEERLTFATPDGIVCWLTDGFEDFNGAIATELTTRAYFRGERVLALKCEVNWDTWNPSLTVAVQSGGQGESVTLNDDPITYDRTKYVLHGATDYDPDTSTAETFDAPHREDYSPAAGELLAARLDAHQNLTEHFRLRLRDRAPQVVISNTQGSVRINRIELSAKPMGSAATKET